MDIVLRESDRLNETIRSFLAFARPQRAAVARRRRPPDRHRHGAAARRTTPSVTDAHAIVVDVPAEPVVLPRRRGADPPDRLEPGDQRAARDARRRPAAAARRGAAGVGGRGAEVVDRASTTRASASRRRTSTASSSRSAAGSPRHRPRPVDRPPHRQRLRRRSPGHVAAGQGHQRRSRAAHRPTPTPPTQWALADAREGTPDGRHSDCGAHATASRIGAHPRRRRRAIDARDAGDPAQARGARGLGRRERAGRDRAAATSEPFDLVVSDVADAGHRRRSRCCATRAAINPAVIAIMITAYGSPDLLSRRCAARRQRLRRKAVQHRGAALPHPQGARSQAAAAGERAAQARDALGATSSRTSSATAAPMLAGVRAGRDDRADRQHGADHRRVGHRQGADRARDPRPLAAQRPAVRRASTAAR